MADETSSSPPPQEPVGIQPAPSAAAGPAAQNVTTAPDAAPPEGPPFSMADFTKSTLRAVLNGVIGAAVGAVVGFLLYLVLWAIWGSGDWRLLTGGGLLAGIFFNHFIIHALRLTPRKELEAQAAARAGRAAADGPPPDGKREVVETVVFVVVLVLMLKSFDAEAFVIPTGSMAETLLGYQKWVVCPRCGYHFPVNCSQQVDPTEPPAVWVSGCTCPNCRQHINFVPRDKWHESSPPHMDEVADPDWGSGDRVLVSKFAYDLFDTPPDRMDVVVFKFPGNPDFPHSGPFKDGVPMNYIKRLVGLPGETIAIHDGDLYVLPPDKGLRYDDRDVNPLELWEKDHMHQNDPGALARFDGGEFDILRKSPDNINAMKRIVYDNDHPRKPDNPSEPLPQRWTDRDKGAGWAPATEAGMGGTRYNLRLEAPSDDKVHWLGYRHVLPDGPDKPQLITDFMAYNTAEPSGRLSGVNWVGDLILECEVQADKPQGELTLELSKGVDRFRARFDLATGVCTLLRVRDDQEDALDSKPTALKGGGRHGVRFANVDERLTVWVDEALAFGDGVTYKPPEKDAKKVEGPTEKNDLQPASIGLKGAGATVRGLRLWRDTYYTTGNFDRGNPAYPDAGTGVDFADPTTWGKMSAMPTKTLYVQPGHFLCLGDNSPQSSDGRSWGLVPERLLLGKALAVYYPFDRFGRIR